MAPHLRTLAAMAKGGGRVAAYVVTRLDLCAAQAFASAVSGVLGEAHLFFCAGVRGEEGSGLSHRKGVWIGRSQTIDYLIVGHR